MFPRGRPDFHCQSTARYTFILAAKRKSLHDSRKKMNCSTDCPLDGTPRSILRGLLEDYRTSKDSSARRQYRPVRIRLLVQYSTVRNEDRYRTSIDTEIKQKREYHRRMG
jgi:hypothetical protein